MNATTYAREYLEGGDGYNHSEIIEKRTAEARFTADLARDGWTFEGTMARRAAWNAKVASYKASGKRINIFDLERAMGFTHNALKVAIAHHNL